MDIKEIPGFPGYSASRNGEIFLAGRRLKTHLDPVGVGRSYPAFHAVSENGKRKKLRVHRAVLFAFVGPPKEREFGRHLNDNPLDNRLENLAWGSDADNHADMVRNGNSTKGERNAMSRLTETQVRELHAAYSGGEKLKSLAARFGVGYLTAYDIVSGTTWKHLGLGKARRTESHTTRAVGTNCLLDKSGYASAAESIRLGGKVSSVAAAFGVTEPGLLAGLRRHGFGKISDIRAK